MKKLHLLCNAHLDPAWLWRWNEGLAEALSTFRIAADFCEKYDGFIFNHNEALLYEWVEEHEPELFARIQKLVKKGKWVIIGGWYLQPDCVMTSGESLISQIELGRNYFREKFGVEPKTAMNVDPFGHTRGLVQILKQHGYENYLFMRPRIIEGDFLWEGFDGSTVLAHRIWKGYGTLKGAAKKKLDLYLEANQDSVDTGLLLWGIGNHGGGPSKIDLETLNEWIKTSSIETVHSSTEPYFAEVDRDTLPTVSRSLIPTMVGCYTSMVRIKQGNRRLENKIALTEKALNYAGISDGKELNDAKKALAFCQFHDILPGSAIQPVEEDSLKTLGYGEEICDKLYMKAFLKLCEGQKKAPEGTIPILAFNPHPYEITGEFELGFILQNQNFTDNEMTFGQVVDENGNLLPTQNEVPECNFSLDWPKKICFRGTLAPSSITRFDCLLNVVNTETLPKPEYDLDYITVKNDRMTVRINRKTGLIDTYEVDGKSLLKQGGLLEVYRDNGDPWGTRVDSYPDLEGSFRLMNDAEVNNFSGYPEETRRNVSVIEDGDVRIKVQALFAYDRSVAVVEYTIPKQGTYVDVDVRLFSNNPFKMIKYRFDTSFSGTPMGETAFGSEELFRDGKESVYHKWCGIEKGAENLYILNKGTYGGSFSENTVRLSLLHSALYSAMPIDERPLALQDRFIKHMDMGERTFSFRITTGEDVVNQAQIFNEEPQLLSVFPSGKGEKKGSFITVDNPKIILSSVKTKENKTVLTMYNTSKEKQTATLTTANGSIRSVTFGKYQLQNIEL